MNSELKDRVFILPQNLIDHIKSQPEIEGLHRGTNILKSGTVTYGQLKRILHDMKEIRSIPGIFTFDSVENSFQIKRYNYYGGNLMWEWGITTLTNERDAIKNRKESKKIADDISGLSGERQNASIQRHTKNTFSPKINPNDVTKPNSEKFSNASMFSSRSLKLTEQINRMKKLM